MKKQILLLAISIASLISCTKEKDIVLDTEAVASNEWRTALVAQLQNAATDEERQQIMAEHGPRLTHQLIVFLRQNGYNCPIDTILYRYGTGEAKSVTSGDSKLHDGIFNNQPYAIVKGGTCFRKDGKNGLYVFIRCFNGTFEIVSSNSKDIGAGVTRFTIEKGYGINHYVDYMTSIWVAESFGIPLYKGRDQYVSKQISYEQARNLQNELDRTQVTARVYAGDVFDLGNMTYNGRTKQ